MEKTHPCSASAPASPDLPVFGHTVFEVSVSEFGYEGNMIGHGHIPAMLFFAACDDYLRTLEAMEGIDYLAGLMVATVRDGISHTWAVRAPKHTGCLPECEEFHDHNRDPQEWVLRFGPDHQVTAETPGAFPVTVGEWF